MTVEGWVLEAVQAAGARGASVREAQRWIDEYRGEELAIDTIERALASLVAQDRIVRTAPDRWTPRPRTDRADAVRRLFGE